MQLTDRVFILPHDSSLDRPTLGYILGDNYSVMIDCGTSSKHLELFNKGILERKLPKPKCAIITHWHWDHTFAMHAFEGITIANQKTNNRLIEMQKWLWTDEEMNKRLNSGEEIEFCDTFIRKEYPDLSAIKIVSADIVFSNNLRLDLGGIHCEIEMIGWQHSEDSNLIYLPEEKIFFVGDADSEDFYTNEGKYHKDNLIEIIEFWNNKDFVWHIHGHDNPQNKKTILEILQNELNKL